MGIPGNPGKSQAGNSSIRALVWVLVIVLGAVLLRPLFHDENGVPLSQRETFRQLEIQNDFTNGIFDGRPELVHKAMNAGLDLNAKMLNNWMPLKLYVSSAPDTEESEALLRTMIGRGMDATAIGDIVAYALVHRKTRLARVLLEHGARVDAVWESPVHGMKSRTALMSAVESKNADAVEMLLSFGADPYQRTSRGISAMDLAEGEIAERLKQAYAKRNANTGNDANAFVEGGLTPLVVAIRARDLEEARRLLDGGADPNLDAPAGVNPLAEAARAGDLQLLELLLLRGADPYRVAVSGETALHEVAVLDAQHAVPALKRLLATPGDVDVKDTAERTALYRALDERRWILARELIRHGANPLAKGKWGLPLSKCVGEWAPATAVMLEMLDIVGRRDVPQKLLANWLERMLGNNSGEVTEQRFLALLEELKKRGFDFRQALEETTNNGRSVAAEQILLAAVNGGWLRTVRMLGEMGVIRRDRLLESQLKRALEIPARAGNTEMLRALLASGTDPIEVTALANMAMFGAIEGNHRETVLMLVQFGADSKHVPEAGRSALDLAETMERSDAAALLSLQREARNKPAGALTCKPSGNRDERREQLILAVRSGDVACARSLIEQGAPVNSSDRLGWTPLHHAASRADLEMARMLVEQGAKAKTSPTELPVQHVVGTEAEPAPDLVQRETGMLEFLFENGAYTLASDDKRRSILHIAIIRDRPEWLKAMRGRPASWLTPDDTGDTPLMYLQKRASADFLLGILADPQSRWREERAIISSLMPRAVDTQSPELFRLLLDIGASPFFPLDKRTAVMALTGIPSLHRPRDWEKTRADAAAAFARRLEKNPPLVEIYAELIVRYGVLDPYPDDDRHSPAFQNDTLRNLHDSHVYARLVTAAAEKAPRWVFSILEAGHVASDNALLIDSLERNSRMSTDVFLGHLAYGAVVLGNTRLLVYLLEKRALDPNRMDESGQTLLDIALRWNQPAIVDVLLLRGAVPASLRPDAAL